MTLNNLFGWACSDSMCGIKLDQGGRCPKCHRTLHLTINELGFMRITAPSETLQDVCNSLTLPDSENDSDASDEVKNLKRSIYRYALEAFIPHYRMYMEKIRPLLPLSYSMEYKLALHEIKETDRLIRKNGLRKTDLTNEEIKILKAFIDSIGDETDDFENILSQSIKIGILNMVNSSITDCIYQTEAEIHE